MSSILKSYISNSESITERHYHDYSSQPSLLNHPANVDDTQSASVTTNGFLWQRRLAELVAEIAFPKQLPTIEELHEVMESRR